jgi:hypothetical protein
VLSFPSRPSWKDAWLSTAVAELLSAELAAGEKVVVLPGERVARVKAELNIWPDPVRAYNTSATELASWRNDTVGLRHLRALTSAQYVVSASCWRAGNGPDDRLQLDAWLQDAESGEVVLAFNELGTKSELFELASRAAGRMRQALGIGDSSADDLRRARASIPSNIEALQLYAQGLSNLRKYLQIRPSDARHEITEARELLRKAVPLSPDNPIIHAILARAELRLGYQKEWYDEIKLAGLKLLTWNPDLELPIENRKQIVAISNDAKLALGLSLFRSQPSDIVVVNYRELFDRFPENLEYGLAEAQASGRVYGEDTRAILADLRKLPAPMSEDPRIDLSEAVVVQSLPKGEDLAAHAADKAHALGARLTYADAKAREGHIALLAGDIDRAEAALKQAERTYLDFGVPDLFLDVLHDSYVLQWLSGAMSSELAKVLSSADAVANELGGPLWKMKILEDRIDFALWSGDLSRASSYILAYEQLATKLVRTSDVVPQPLLGRVLIEIAQAQGPADGGRFASGSPARTSSSLEAFVSGDIGKVAAFLEMELRAETHPLTAPWQPRLRPQKGDVLLAQGNIGAARRAFEAALTTSEASGAQPDFARASLGLGAVALEDKRFSEAEQLAQEALSIFRKHRIALFEPAARIALARALLGQNKTQEARGEIERAAELARGLQLHREELEAAVLSARLDATSKKRNDVDKALGDLKKITSDAVRLELKYQEFRARQAIAEIEIAAGIRAGQTDLAALKQDAGNAGFGLFTR